MQCYVAMCMHNNYGAEQEMLSVEIISLQVILVVVQLYNTVTVPPAPVALSHSPAVEPGTPSPARRRSADALGTNTMTTAAVCVCCFLCRVRVYILMCGLRFFLCLVFQCTFYITPDQLSCPGGTAAHT